MGERNFYKHDGRVFSTPDRNLDPEAKKQEKEVVIETIKYLADAGREVTLDEMLKTPEEQKLIPIFSQYIKEEADNLGVSDLRQPISSEKIHFFWPDIYDAKASSLIHDLTRAHYDPSVDAIYAQKSESDNIWQMAHITLHEMIHSSSAIRYDLNKEGIFDSLKVGYSSSRLDKSAEVSEIFSGLNEAVTDLMVKEILDRHQTDLKRELNISTEEIESSPLHFYNYCPWVEWIMDKIAENNQEDKAAVWQKFKLGMMTGKIMHLREIEKVLGVGALRLVAKIGNSEKDDLAFREFMDNYDKNK